MKTPKGWEKALLHNVAHVQTGLSKSEGRTGPSIRKPYLRVANVQEGYLDLTEVKETDVPLSQAERYRLHVNDVLLTEGGDFDKLGRGCIWHNEISDCVHQNHVFAVRVTKPELLLPHFLAYQIQSVHAKNYFLSCAKQTTNLASINSSQIKQLPLLLPPLDEQRGIVQAVCVWDVAIEKTERLIAAKRVQFAGLVNQLIIRRAKTEASWKHASIQEIAERIQRQTDGKDYSLLTISSASGFVRQEEKYSRYMAGESAKSYTLLRNGEFAYNKGNSLRYQFGCVFQLQSYEVALVPHVYVCFRLKDSVHAGYMRHLFAADYLKPQLGALVKTGVRNNGLLNIRPEEFMGVTVPIPPLEEQQRIADVLDTAESEIAFLTQQLNAYRQQKRGLMQKLLTGQWRIPVEEGERSHEGIG